MPVIRNEKTVIGEVFQHNDFGICSTSADEQIKEVYCPLFKYYIGARISIKFNNGNTFGSCVGTDSNVIAVENAQQISLNGETHPIYVGGEPAGEGFINAGDVHDFVYDGTNWCDVTADVIYKGGDSNTGYYEKKRNGLITQRFYQRLNVQSQAVTKSLLIKVSAYAEANTCTATPTLYGYNGMTCRAAGKTFWYYGSGRVDEYYQIKVEGY